MLPWFVVSGLNVTQFSFPKHHVVWHKPLSSSLVVIRLLCRSVHTLDRERGLYPGSLNQKQAEYHTVLKSLWLSTPQLA